MSSAPHMFRDTFGTPLVDTVMAKETLVFQSRSEHKAAMKARGLRLMETHVGLPGTDKSPHTQKWDGAPAGVALSSEDDVARVGRLADNARFQAARRSAIETHRERQDHLDHYDVGRRTDSPADDAPRG
jgi:hypothetical protein